MPAFANLTRISLFALTCFVLSASVAAPVQAAGAELITNGNFESGSFAGWTRQNAGESEGAFARDFYLSTPGANTPGPPSFATALNPTGGAFYAVSTSDAPGESALLQTFTMPTDPIGSLTLSFQMFINDQSESRLFGGPFIDSSGLDHATGGVFNNNQHARVDILSSSAAPFSTASGDVVRSLFLGLDSASLTNGYTNHSFDLTSFLTPGHSYQLRFAEVDNLSALNMGVDNVSLIASPDAAPIAAAPEPGAAALLGLPIFLFFAVRIRRANHKNAA